MKKTVYFGMMLMVFMLFSCSNAKVEDAAKEHVEKRFHFGDTVKIDTSKLKYEVKEEGDTASVKVTGKIKYEEEIHFIKEDGKWMINKKTVSATKQKKLTSHAEQKKAISPVEPKKEASPEGHHSSHAE